MEIEVRTDEELAAQAAREASDGLAFSELVERFKPRIWRVCYRLMGNEEDARDAAQEVLLRMFTCRGQFAQKSKYSTWVHGMAVRTCLHLRRGRGRRLRRVGSTEQEMLEQQPSGPSRPASEPGARLDMAAMLETLGEEDRAMLILKYAEDYKFEELAEMFDLSVSACKMRLSRAREKLQQEFPDAIVDR